MLSNNDKKNEIIYDSIIDILLVFLKKENMKADYQAEYTKFIYKKYDTYMLLILKILRYIIDITKEKTEPESFDNLKGLEEINMNMIKSNIADNISKITLSHISNILDRFVSIGLFTKVTDNLKNNEYYLLLSKDIEWFTKTDYKYCLQNEVGLDKYKKIKLYNKL